MPRNCWCGHSEDDHYERTDVPDDSNALYGCIDCDAEEEAEH